MNPLNQHLNSDNAPYSFQQLLKQSSEDWYIAKSDIQGQGVFASIDYDVGEVIGVGATPGDVDDFGAKIWNLTTLSRYCNHQGEPNAKLVKGKKTNNFEIVAIKPIEVDDEITASYVQVTRAIGPHAYMYWAGEPVPSTNLEDFVEKQSADKQDTKTWYHSCCGKPAGDCPGCHEGCKLVLKEDLGDSRT